jgi:transposase
MAYNPTALGILIFSNPPAASAELRKLFAKLKTLDAVAKDQNVDRHTIQRWIARLVAAGLTDPRVELTKKGPAKTLEVGAALERAEERRLAKAGRGTRPIAKAKVPKGQK